MFPNIHFLFAFNFLVNLGLCRIIHVRKGLENDIERHGDERHKNHQEPRHGPGCKYVGAYPDKVRISASSSPPQHIVYGDEEYVKEIATPDDTLPCVCHATEEAFADIFSACEGWPVPMDDRAAFIKNLIIKSHKRMEEGLFSTRFQL